ncbi:MAG: hypothetical protein KY475_02935 [Planctomycetes bacterium]|nr:hypothetical protein [Planctomycetota bacterium]
MSPLRTSALLWVILGGNLVLGTGARADEPDELREAWNARLRECKTVTYGAVAIRIKNETPAAKQTELRIHARMNCEARKFRFEVGENTQRPTTVLIADESAFHTCTRTADGWEVASARSIERDSNWLHVYPFLLAHGVVPLPPFEAPRLNKGQGEQRPSRRRLSPVAEATFRFPGKEPMNVEIGHNAEGLVSRYSVSSKEQRLLEIHNTYQRRDGAVRLDRFRVFVFASGGALATRLDGDVEHFVLDAPMGLEIAAKPVSSRELTASLDGLMNKTVKVEIAMTADGLTRAIQSACGNALQVRADAEALGAVPTTDGRALLLEPGDAPLSELLFRDLRQNHMDFRFDLHGITIIPRALAWKEAEFVEYSAAEFGLSPAELRDHIQRTAPVNDDWSDVGGPAQMFVDEERGVVAVFHAQSDHFQFRHTLTNLPRDEE